MMNLLQQEITADRGSVEADYQARLADLNQRLSSAQRRRSASLVYLAGRTIVSHADQASRRYGSETR